MRILIEELCKEAKDLEQKLKTLALAAENIGLDLTVENGEFTFENAERYVKRCRRRKEYRDEIFALSFLLILIALVTGVACYQHFDILKETFITIFK